MHSPRQWRWNVATGGAARRRSRPTLNPWKAFFMRLAQDGAKESPSELHCDLLRLLRAQAVEFDGKYVFD